MKIATTQTNLNAALSRLQGVSASAAHSSLEILKCVKLTLRTLPSGKSVLVLTGSDLDKLVETNAECEVSDSLGECSCAINYRRFAGVVSSAAPGMVSISITPKNVEVKTDTGEYAFATADTSLFPPTPNFNTDFSVKIASTELRRLFSSTRFSAASPSEMRKVLQCTLMEFENGIVRCVATNGRSLAKAECEASVTVDSEKSALIPQSSVADILRLAPKDSTETTIRITSEGKGAVFDFGDTKLYTRLCDDTYPQYKRVIPNAVDATAIFTLGAVRVASAVKRVAVMVVDETRYVTCGFKNGTLTISTDDDAAKEILPVEALNGECAEIRMDDSMLVDAIESAGEDKLMLYYFGAEKPVVISNTANYLAVVMPMRV